MQARDVMSLSVATIGSDATVRQAAELMLERGVSALPVVDRDDGVVGIISEGDLVRRVELGTDHAGSWWLRLLASAGDDVADYVKTHSTLVRDVMTSPIISVSDTTSLDQIALLFEKHRIKRVPVIGSGQLVGIVSRADLVRQLAIAPAAPPSNLSDDRTLRATMLQRLKSSGMDTTYISVMVSDGAMHLWGGVRTELDRSALRVAAESLAGLRRVEDHTYLVPLRAKLRGTE